MDIETRKQLEQLEYIKDKLEYIEYSESLQCYVEKLNGIPTGVAAWVNGAFYGFEQAAKAQAVMEWISVEDELPTPNKTFSDAVIAWDGLCIRRIPLCLFNSTSEVTHWMPIPQPPKAQEPAND